MLLRHSGYYLLASGLPGLINFLAIYLYTRLLTPEEYGRYALIVAGVGLFNVVFFQWLRLALLRFFPAYEHDPRPLISTLLASFAIALLLTGCAGFAIALLWPSPTLRPFILLGITLLWATAWFELNLELSRIQLMPKRYGAMATFKSVTALAVGTSLTLIGLNAYGPLLGLLLGLLFAGAYGLRIAIWHVKPALDRETLSDLFRYGAPLTATFALAYIVSASDRLILAFFMGETEAGLYSAPYDLANQSLTLAMTIVNLAAYPLAVRALKSAGKDAATAQLQKNAVILLAVALPSATGLAALSPNIAETVLGDSFSSTTAFLLPIIALASVLAGFRAYYFDVAFQLGQWTTGQIWVMSIAAITNVVLNLLLIPTFGMAGAAWATVSAYGAALAASIVLGKGVFQMDFPWQDFLKLVTATSIMGIALISTPGSMGWSTLISQVLLGVTIYISMLLVLNVASIRTRISTLWRQRL